jgi:peptidoglycan/LPS O-acetylase OafA/YrhL
LQVSKPERIRELDGWRGLSVLMVIAHHLLTFTFPSVGARFQPIQHVATFIGSLGVQIFFVISGFVITRLLLIEEKTNGAVSLKGFYLRRVFRIVPVFALFLSVVALFRRLGFTPVHAHDLLYSACFLKDFDLRNDDWFLGHTWTLAVEEQFYVTFPILFVALSGRKRRSALLSTTMLTFVAWSVLCEMGLIAAGPYPTTLVGFCCVNLGTLLALYEPEVRSFAGRLPAYVPVLLATLLLIHPFPRSPLGFSAAILVAPPCVGLMLMCTISRASWIGAMLKSSLLQWVGLVSYSAYLWQQLFTGPKVDYGSPSAAAIFRWMIPGILLIAAGSYYCVERPSMRLGRRLSARFAARAEARRSVFAPTSYR